MIKKDKSYFSLSKDDRLLALSGVPISYIKKPVNIEQFNFLPTTITYSPKEVTVIQSEYQSKFILEFIDKIACIGEPSTYAIGSYPTDQASYQLAVLITKTYYNSIVGHNIYPTIKWIDLGSPDWEYLKSEDGYSLVVIHGISENSSDPRRFDIAKDFVRKGNGTKILLAVTSNILNFVINKIEIYPDGVWQLARTTNRVVV